MLIVERASRRARAVSRFARRFSRFNRRFSDLSCRTCLRFWDFTCRCWLLDVAVLRVEVPFRAEVLVVVLARFVAVCRCRAVLLARVGVLRVVERVPLELRDVEVVLRGRVYVLRVELRLRVVLEELLGLL